MFDPQATIADQRCVPAGSRLGVKVGLDATRNLVHTGSAGNETRELDVLLRGGHRNIVVQPVQLINAPPHPGIDLACPH